MVTGKIGTDLSIKGMPYILHPLEVSQIISTMNDDIEVIAAGVLHDVVEDTNGTLAEIKKRFGDRVAMLVDSETENDIPGEDREATWRRRKEQSLEKLKQSTDIGVKMLWLADKLSNLRSLARTYGEVGEKMWDYLHQKDPEIQLWYYKTIAENIEMELNKTGSYKEYIDRINYIWPGTFDSSKAKYREYREISVDGCECIGRGAKAEVFRYDDELIVKVYNEKNTYKDVERETALSRTVFVLGLPTAISFGIVSVGGKGKARTRYGAMFELIDAKTVSEHIALNPAHTEYYAGIMADLAWQIHDTSPLTKAKDCFPNAAVQMENRIDRALADEDKELAAKLKTVVEKLPPTENLVHGDLHTGNVFISNGEPLFIDVDRMSVGDPIVDLSGMYLFYVGYNEVNPKLIEDFMGFSEQTAKRFFDSFIRQYLGTDDEAIIRQTVQKAALFAYVRLIGQIKKHSLSDKDRADIAGLIGKIRALMSDTAVL